MTPTEYASAAYLTHLYNERTKAAKFAGIVTNTDTLNDVERISDQLDDACEEFRQRYYPGAVRVFVACWLVIVETGEDGDESDFVTVFDATAIYNPTAKETR